MSVDKSINGDIMESINDAEAERRPLLAASATAPMLTSSIIEEEEAHEEQKSATAANATNSSIPRAVSFQDASVASAARIPRKYSRVRETKDAIITRRPQFYINAAGNISANNVTDYGSVDTDSRSASVSASISRYKYYNKLAPFEDTPFVMPDHVVPSNFFIIIPIKRGEGQSSIITIFSIWNTMMGTSLLAMPWAMTQAGFAMGIAIIFVMGVMTFYTCFLTVRLTSTHPCRPGVVLDFSDLCEYYLGKAGRWICFLFSAIAFLGALIVFWVLMSNFLFNTGKYIHDEITGIGGNSTNSNETITCDKANLTIARSLNVTHVSIGPPSTFDDFWDLQKTCPFWLLLLIFPLINLKSATFFTKFNVLGTVSVFYLFFFVTYHAVKWGPCMVLTPLSSPFAVEEFSLSFPALAGTLSLAMFIHNGIMAILRNQKKPQNNTRDLSIAYLLVTVTYMYVGVIFYVTFPHLDKSLIPDNFLNFFAPNDILAVAARAFLLIQMIAVFPLLIYILRIQVMHAFFNSIWPSALHVVTFNVVLLVICSLVACFFPSVGTIIRYAGSACGLALIFTLPCLVLLLKRKAANQITWEAIVIHGFLILIGVAIFISQFFL